MSLLDNIGEDLKAAMKDKDMNRVSALRLIRAEIVKREKEKAGTKLTDEVIIQVLQSMVRGIEDAIEQFRKGGRDDLVEKEEKQLDVVRSFLPEKISAEDIKKEVKEAITQTGALSRRDFGKVMGVVMRALKETGKLIDGNEVKDLLGAALEELEKEE